MLKSIEVKNFKAFSEFSLKLRRINVLVGPNNSGKSSILAVLKLLAQTIHSNDEEVPLLLNGTFADFGTYKDLVYKNHRGKPIQITFSADLSDQRFPHHKDVKTTLSYKYRLAQREIVLDNVRLSSSADELVAMKYSTTTSRHIVESIFGRAVPSELKSTLSREFRMSHFLPKPLAPILGVYDKQQPPLFENFLSRVDDRKLRELSRVSNRLYALLDSIDYVGPVRTAPQRTYLFTGERRGRIGASGENVTSLIVKAATQSASRKKDFDVLKAVGDWMARAGMAKSVTVEPISDRHYEVRVQNLYTNERQNIADVGYGHSQILPVLVGGYALRAGSMYMIEQPEIHLHPKAQAELGDFLADLYERNIQTVVETHSEHLILRLQQHVAAGRLDPKSIRFFYVTSQGLNQNKRIFPLSLDENGVFAEEWPEGFFPERLFEARELALIRSKKRAKPA